MAVDELKDQPHQSVFGISLLGDFVVTKEYANVPGRPRIKVAIQLLGQVEG